MEPYSRVWYLLFMFSIVDRVRGKKDPSSKCPTAGVIRVREVSYWIYSSTELFGRRIISEELLNHTMCRRVWS